MAPASTPAACSTSSASRTPATRSRPSAPRRSRRRRPTALRELCLRGRAGTIRWSLEIEDLHWIDRTSEEYLAFLAESLGDARILLVATYRPGYRPPWSDQSLATQLSLGRLAPGDKPLDRP